MRTMRFSVEHMLKDALKDAPKDALPPKKHGDKSMWGKRTDTEPKRLIALRQKAVEKLGSQPLTGEIRLTLTVHVGVKDFDKLDRDARAKAVKNVGDLDNFVAGVCDGLMAAHPNTPNTSFHDLFGKPENSDVHPTIPIAFEDDSQIVKINAERRIRHGDHRWYEVGLEGD